MQAGAGVTTATGTEADNRKGVGHMRGARVITRWMHIEPCALPTDAKSTKSETASDSSSTYLPNPQQCAKKATQAHQSKYNNARHISRVLVLDFRRKLHGRQLRQVCKDAKKNETAKGLQEHEYDWIQR